MVGEEEKSPVSTAQGPGPEESEKRKHGGPRQVQGAVRERFATVQPLLHGLKCAPQRRKCRRRIQAAAPATEGGRIGKTIGIFQSRRGAFPRAVLPEASLQYLTARDQTVMGVG